jgi:hypothetical protein
MLFHSNAMLLAVGLLAVALGCSASLMLLAAAVIALVAAEGRSR